MLKELGKADWLRILNVPESRIPTALILLTDVEKGAKRKRANQAARELAFALALELDVRYRHEAF